MNKTNPFSVLKLGSNAEPVSRPEPPAPAVSPKKKAAPKQPAKRTQISAHIPAPLYKRWKLALVTAERDGTEVLVELIEKWCGKALSNVEV